LNEEHLRDVKLQSHAASAVNTGSESMLVPLMLCLSLAPADVYSFGVVLWELATGQEPWAEASPMQVDIAALCIHESAMP